jgi:hypothetical protein
MQLFMRRLTDNSFVLPFIILLICIWRIFVPQLPANDGLGWDGYKYYAMALDGLHSNVLDSYLVLRIFPSLFIHAVLKTASVAIAPASVILSFKIMNTVLITLSAWMVKKIFDFYSLSPIAQLTGFIIVFMNYGVLNFTFYYPVMTDTPAFFLSVALFYFFVKGEMMNIFLIGLIGAFTWPVLFAMAIALILFPHAENEFIPLQKSGRYALGILCFAYAMLMGWYLVFKQGEKADLAFTLPISYGMLPVSFLAIGLLYFFMPLVLGNKLFFQLSYYRSQWNSNRVFAIVALIIVSLIIRASLTVNASSEYLSLYHQIKIHLFYAFQRPLITVVSHFNYFGCVMLLMIIFWRKFAAYISSFGLGVAGSVFFCLFVFSMKPESRALIFFFPWLMIMMALFLGRYKFGAAFYLLIALINLAAAKLWLFFEYKNGTLLSDGTIDFPEQWFMMHLGIWMTENVWLWLCLFVAVLLTLLMFSLYKIEFGKKAFLFYKKYEAIPL